MKKKVIIVNSRANAAGAKPGARRFWSSRRGKIMIVCAAALAVALTVGVTYAYHLWNKFDGMNALIDGPTPAPMVEDRVTALVIGVDGGDANTDTIMLMMLDCKTKDLSVLSIPRDTRVKNPYGGSGYARVNSVYAAKGVGALVNQITEMTGVPINYYLKVDTKAFRAAIDVLGGVDFDVPMRMKYSDPAQDLYIDLQPGLQKLNGDKAEQLVRYRYGYAMADLDRTTVQRDFIKATIQQHAKASNLLKLDELFDAIVPYIKTNVTLKDMVRYAPTLTQLGNENFHMFMLPGGVDGSGYYRQDEMETQKLIDELFWKELNPLATIRPQPTDKPTPVKPAPTVKPEPTLRAPDPDPTARPVVPSPAGTAPPRTESPAETPSVAQTAPPVTAAPQTALPAPSRAPTQTNSPNGYPEGL